MKLLTNKVYNGGRIMYATYNGERWTTNTYIAERGEVEPRVYKDTDDLRGRQGDNMPKMESIVDAQPYHDRYPVESVADNLDGTVTVSSGHTIRSYNATYMEYLQKKYPKATLLLEPVGRTSKLIAYEGATPVAVLMGLRD